MARKGRAPRTLGKLPPPLPPETRTVGQLVAESIRLYGRRFWQTLARGADDRRLPDAVGALLPPAVRERAGGARRAVPREPRDLAAPLPRRGAPVLRSGGASASKVGPPNGKEPRCRRT